MEESALWEECVGECSWCGNLVPEYEIYITVIGNLCEDCYWEAVDCEDIEEE